jgi:G3E family GTPase
MPPASGAVCHTEMIMTETSASILAPAPRTDQIVIPGRDPVPVTLLTGFLGAGKTTLLNRILNGRHGLRVGVLVNDFGAINIDAELVDGVEENTISLTNGCVCCEIRDDLVKSLEQLLTRADAIDYVILEASGVADPEGIVMTFLDQRYENLLRLDSITCVIDAEAVFADGDNEALNMLKLRQIGFADLVVLNKTDLVGPEHVEVIRDWVDHHIRRIRIIEATRCDVPLEILLAVGRFDPVTVVSRPDGSYADEHGHHHGHGEASSMFQTWSYESDRPFSLDKLRQMVRRELPASVYRCKGIIFAADSSGRRLALQAVGRRTEISELDEWGERTPRTQIVAIGSAINAQELSGQFDACLEKF